MPETRTEKINERGFVLIAHFNVKSIPPSNEAILLNEKYNSQP